MEPSRRAQPIPLAKWSGALLLLAGLFGLTLAAVAQSPRDPRFAARPYLNMPPRLPLKPGQWVPVPAFPHLHFQIPTFLAPAPRSNRLFLCEHEGVVKSFVNDPETTEIVTVLDISNHCQAQGDCGLLGLAFHPEFGKEGSPYCGYFYLCYNHSPNPVRSGETLPKDKKTEVRLSRFTIPDGSQTADPNSELVLIAQTDEHVYHTGGPIFFHPDDGFLYLALGDEGDDGGKLGNCQRIDRDLFAGVLRIDVDCDPSRGHPPPRQPDSGKTAHYFIPNDNPFVGMPNVLEEFWALGVRNPHRMTYDPETKAIWLGDVGQGGDAREEVNVVIRGGNYQWNYKEGTIDKPQYAKRPVKILGKERPPLYEYPHSEGNHCIIGGYVYRGTEHAGELGGRYIFGDHGSGRIWALVQEEGQPAKAEELCQLPPRCRMLTTFGIDHQGEVYLCAMGPTSIWKLAKAGSPAAPLGENRPVPQWLSQTGAFARTQDITPAPGLLPYNVNAPLWADGAAKKRWIAVPAESPIQFQATDYWKFPSGTVLVKHFELPPQQAGEPPYRIETRLMVCEPDGAFYGVTYKWNDAQTDAELLPGGLEEPVLPRGSLGHPWTYPSRSECLTCHNVGAGFVLGVNSRQLNRVEKAPEGISENQLKTWSRLGLMDRALTDQDIAGLARLVALNDKSAGLETRVRSYLDANCSHCHRPWGARAYFDARFETPPERRALVSCPVLNPLGVKGMLAICPGDPEKSLVYLRMRDSGSIKMPPLGRLQEDAEATATMREWILSLTKPPSSRDVQKRAGVLAGSIFGAFVLALVLRRGLRWSGRRRVQPNDVLACDLPYLLRGTGPLGSETIARLSGLGLILSPWRRWLIRLLPVAILLATPGLVVLTRFMNDREIAPVWLFATGAGVASILSVVLACWVPFRTLQGDRVAAAQRGNQRTNRVEDKPRRKAAG